MNSFIVELKKFEDFELVLKVKKIYVEFLTGVNDLKKSIAVLDRMRLLCQDIGRYREAMVTL